MIYSLTANPDGKSHGARTNITIAGDPTAGGGFDFVQVPDEFKPLFLDAMNGFCDYAKLKGYTVDISTDASHPGKVGIKITIVDIGVTVSTSTVRRDVDDYLRRLKEEDDFSDMPMPENSAEHVMIVSALQARFAYVKTQLEMHKIRSQFLEKMVKDVLRTGLGAIGYKTAPQVQTLQLTLQNDGGKNMRDSYEASNSQNIAQGKGASAHTNESNIQIGNNHSERNQRIEALKDFAKKIKSENLTKETEGEVVRYIENARDELENASEPNPDEIAKWLDRANKTISTVSASAGLVTKLHDLLTMFGLS
ncbi:hypothetical protein GGR25_003457 [Kaistia hirudinis]|uniref:Uncharacterized protein n=1 Tax=Kaistia hirudinis TaxID=1293440 RepID=A0A840AQ46_9HYPH|nr:hypothetical protein [Kaistia hirudinis]MBB3932399.1 hypothetical protein [Kaistia hirudinis]